MKLTNLTIKEIFAEEPKLTFLVGAGCSMDAPSCLPVGYPMMEAIVKYTCAESEVKKILDMEELRFEALVELVRDRLDPNLKIIDFYGLCDKPNVQHFFLAEMIKKGNFVITTNFDFLIEHALLQSDVPKDEIKVLITKNDFEKFNNPYDLFEQGKKTLYKIHGSTQNTITGEETRDSLIATIQAFGSNKEGLNVFQVEPFKRKLFDNISGGRSLVVMGYSGSDDFDIVPTLKVLKNLRNVIWINYAKDIKMNEEKIYEIDDITSQSLENLDKNLKKVSKILLEIWRMNYVNHVYLINVNTMSMVKELLEIKPKLSSDNFSIDLTDWLKNNIKTPDEFKKYMIPSRIYNDFNMYDDASRCLEEMLSIAERSNNQSMKAAALNNIGMILFAKGKYSEAADRFEEGISIVQQLGDLFGVTQLLRNMGDVYRTIGNYSEALKFYTEALKIVNQLINSKKNLLESLRERATLLNNIAMIYDKQGNYLEALKMYEEGLKIDEELGYLLGKATRLNNIGMNYYMQGNFSEAMKHYEMALKIFDQLGDFSRKASTISNIASIYYNQKNYPEALKKFKEALKIAIQLGDQSGKANRLNNIGNIYNSQGNYLEARKMFEEALNIYQKLGDLPKIAIALNNIASFYYSQKDYPKALKTYEEALKINEKSGNVLEKATILNGIGGVHYAQSNYPKAIQLFEEALQILTQHGLSNTQTAETLKSNIEILRREFIAK